MASLRNKKWFCILTDVCRYLFAVTFICSGFVKAVDPWGTALNIGNYLTIYGLSFLKPCIVVLSIWLSSIELMMGCMMFFKVRVRLISIFAVVSMSFFTLLTFLSATWIPVEDCGCFGEAIKLTPWQTFLKNLALLPMATCVWWRYRCDKILVFSWHELLGAISVFSAALGLSTYCYLHLPLFDLLPYKVGVNIPEAIEQARWTRDDSEVVLICRNRRTGKIREFSIKDKAWHNEKRWEWVDTRVDEQWRNRVEPMILEFYVSDREGCDHTSEILSTRGNLYMLCVTRLDKVDKKSACRLRSVVEHAQTEGSRVVCLTPDDIPASGTCSFGGSDEVECLNMDAKTLKTILRANVGLVVLRDGTIVDKRNCRDIDYE